MEIEFQKLEFLTLFPWFLFLRSSFSKGQTFSPDQIKNKPTKTKSRTTSRTQKQTQKHPLTAKTTPTLGTNSQITKMVLVWVKRDELEIKPPPMVVMMVKGRAKELDHKSSESRGVGSLFLIDLGLLFVSSLLICLLLCDLYLLLSEFVELESQKLDFHIDFHRNRVFDTRVVTVKSSPRHSRCQFLKQFGNDAN